MQIFPGGKSAADRVDYSTSHKWQKISHYRRGARSICRSQRCDNPRALRMTSLWNANGQRSSPGCRQITGKHEHTGESTRENLAVRRQMKRRPPFATILLYMLGHLRPQPPPKIHLLEGTRPTCGPKISSIPISSLYCSLKNTTILLRMSLFVYLKSFDHINIKC